MTAKRKGDARLGEAVEDSVITETAARLPAGPMPSDISDVLSGNLRRLRVKRGLSLERLAQSSGVSRAMLSQRARRRCNRRGARRPDRSGLRWPCWRHCTMPAFSLPRARPKPTKSFKS
jgi:hypothetical protein